MRIQSVSDYFNKDSIIKPEWLEDFDITLVPRFNIQEYSGAIDSQIKRQRVLEILFPQLKALDFKNNLVILGNDILRQTIFKLNSAYQPVFVDESKLSADDYAEYISKQELPISNSGYLYFHDVYFHALGIHNVPDSFTRWWKQNHIKLNQTELIMMACIVEWTTLKGVSPIMEDLFAPEKWNQLELFFMGQDRTICNSKNLNSVYKKFNPLMRKILLEWSKL